MRPPLAFAVALLCALSPGASALEIWSTDLPAALQRAKEKGTLVFVDLWGYPCPSCEYMDANALNTPQMMRLRGELELVKLDVSTPEGAEFSKSRRLIGIPIYMVLDADANELGMTRGDMPRGKFFAWLRESMARRKTLGDSEAAAKADAKDSLASARAVLNAHSLRSESAEGIAFYEGLPKKLRRKVDADPEAGAALQMLRLYAARSAKKGADCFDPGRRLVELKRGRLDAYELFVILACASYQPKEPQKKLAGFLEKPVRRLLKDRVEIAPEKRGPDYKDAVHTAARYYDAIGNPEKAKRIRTRE